jgi:hypothetical protein
MSGVPDKQLIPHRMKTASPDEALFSKTGIVQEDNGTLYLVIPDPAPEMFDIQKGDTLDIHIFEDHYSVPRHTEDPTNE